MPFLPLSLGVGSSSGAGGGGLKPPSKSETEKTLKRDDYTCRFCGFHSTQFQRVIAFKQEYVTACTFCEQTLFLERAGMMGSGILVWLPEIPQAELNHIARAVYVARASEDKDVVALADRAFDALMVRKSEAKKRLGSEDPLVLATVLHENLSAKERAAASDKLEGIRLLPLDKHLIRRNGSDANGFPQMVEFWRSAKGPYAELPASKWGELFEKISSVSEGE
jgi:intracellular multiplication protein IcmJ